jgi:hypothetical protein
LVVCDPAVGLFGPTSFFSFTPKSLFAIIDPMGAKGGCADQRYKLLEDMASEGALVDYALYVGTTAVDHNAIAGQNPS